MKHITMKAYKYNNKLHYESAMQLVEKHAHLKILYGAPKRTLKHYTRGKEFVFDEQSLEFYFNNRWYTVACVIDLEGVVNYYYCNIALPCFFTENEVGFVDLDLDVIIQSDMSYEVVDRDEFEEHKVLFGYPRDLIENTEKALQELIRDIETRKFPFNGYIDECIKKLKLSK